MLGGDPEAATEVEAGPSDATSTGVTGAARTAAGVAGAAGTAGAGAAGAGAAGAGTAGAVGAARGCTVHASTRDGGVQRGTAGSKHQKGRQSDKNKRPWMAVKPSDAELDFLTAGTAAQKRKKRK